MHDWTKSPKRVSNQEWTLAVEEWLSVRRGEKKDTRYGGDNDKWSKYIKCIMPLDVRDPEISIYAEITGEDDILDIVYFGQMPTAHFDYHFENKLTISKKVCDAFLRFKNEFKTALCPREAVLMIDYYLSISDPDFLDHLPTMVEQDILMAILEWPEIIDKIDSTTAPLFAELLIGWVEYSEVKSASLFLHCCLSAFPKGLCALISAGLDIETVLSQRTLSHSFCLKDQIKQKYVAYHKSPMPSSLEVFLTCVASDKLASKHQKLIFEAFFQGFDLTSILSLDPDSSMAGLAKKNWPPQKDWPGKGPL